jgi:hypothetical protein
MGKSRMVKLTERDKTDVTNADVVVGWCTLLLKSWWSSGREKTDVTHSRGTEVPAHH